jgi:hypothetical protein
MKLIEYMIILLIAVIIILGAATLAHDLGNEHGKIYKEHLKSVACDCKCGGK